MVISTPLLFASLSPAAHVTVLDGLRIELGARLLGHRTIEASPHVPVVGTVIGGPKRFWFVVRPRGDHVGALGCEALHRSDEVRVEAQLQNRTPLRLLRKLGVDNLVRPRTETTRYGRLSENIRPAAPAIRLQNTLDHNVRTRAHRIDGLLSSTAVAAPRR